MMRTLSATALTLALAASLPAFAAPAPAPPDVAGKWKLVVLAFGDDEFLIVDLKTADGKVEGKVVDAQKMLGERSKAEVKQDGDALSIAFPGAGIALAFQGRVGADGKALGTIKYSTATYPARLEKTDAEKVGTLGASPSRTKLASAARETDAKTKVAKLVEILHDAPGHPANSTVYTTLLGAAEKAGLGADDVRRHVESWIKDAEPYGKTWAGEIRTRALKAIQGKKDYAGLATELALATEAALPADATLDARGAVAEMLAASAKLAGKADIADRAAAQAKEIGAKLDAEYHEKVPPFKPDTFAGRKDAKANRTVVMEIFTGAECPPCVGADVGFDALLKTYKPTEFIGLQHHLHIPGPDPLTNEDTIARQKYYGAEVRGTPTTFFDGKRAGGSGGLMQHAEAKYREYRGVVDPALETKPQAEIQVTATRTGDELKIVAKADAKAEGSAKPRLRLVLVEESVRYPGGNKLRFHHNVVRGFPGGAEGKALEGGQGSVEVTMKLADLRKKQEEYLAKFPETSGRSFPNPLPPIELDDLAVVAIVQDDADHAIWQGVQVPVKTVNP